MESQKCVTRQFHHGVTIEYVCQLRSYDMIADVLSGPTILCGPLLTWHDIVQREMITKYKLK